MITGEAKHTRCVMGRLERGEPVVESLVELARFEKIDAGFVRAHGCVENVELRRYDLPLRGYERLAAGGSWDGPWELASLAGNVSLLNGAPDVRLWAVLGTSAVGRPEVLAGLLGRATAVYVEFAIDVLDDADLERRDDAVTGLPLWRPPRRR